MINSTATSQFHLSQLGHAIVLLSSAVNNNKLYVTGDCCEAAVLQRWPKETHFSTKHLKSTSELTDFIKKQEAVSLFPTLPCRRRAAAEKSSIHSVAPPCPDGKRSPSTLMDSNAAIKLGFAKQTWSCCTFMGSKMPGFSDKDTTHLNSL